MAPSQPRIKSPINSKKMDGRRAKGNQIKRISKLLPWHPPGSKRRCSSWLQAAAHHSNLNSSNRLRLARNNRSEQQALQLTPSRALAVARRGGSERWTAGERTRSGRGAAGWRRAGRAAASVLCHRSSEPWAPEVSG
jgi:hypothetical protein